MTKDERQELGISKFVKAKAIGSFDYTMRFGKTLSGLKIAKRFRTKYNDRLILIIVPSIAIKDIWDTALDKFDYKFEHLVILTIDSLNNIPKTIDTGLLIVDELHKYTSSNRLYLIINRVNSMFRLGLTGTYPYGNKAIEAHFPVVDVITEKEALENKWISHFIEFNVPLQLNDDDRLEYIKYNTIINNVFTIFKGAYKKILDKEDNLVFENDLFVILACYSGKQGKVNYVESKNIRKIIASKMGWYDELPLINQYNNNIEDNWNPDNIKKNVTRFHNAMVARNYIHNHNIVKLNAVYEIYKKFNNRHFIIFNESIDFANIIEGTINSKYPNKAFVYHSLTKGRYIIDFITKKLFTKRDGEYKKFGQKMQLRYVNEYFRLNIINCIVAVKALDEGLNIENIDFVINTSGTNNPMQYKQRTARGLTIDKYNPNKVTIIINLYFNDFNGYNINGEETLFRSRDKAKLLNRQYNTNRTVKDISLTDLLNNLKINE